MAAAPLRMLAPVAVVHPMGVQDVTPLPRHMASALRTRALVGNNGLMGLQLAPACKALVGREHPKVACIPTTAVASAICPCNAAGVSTEIVCNAYDTVLAFLRALAHLLVVGLWQTWLLALQLLHLQLRCSTRL